MSEIKEIKLNQYEPHRSYIDDIIELSFYVVRKQSSFYKLNYKYIIKDSSNNYLGVYYLVSIKNFTFKDIDSELSFMHKNTTPEIYKDILKYHNFNENSKLIRMVFTPNKIFTNDKKNN